MSAPDSAPQFRELSRAEAEEILARNHVGRIGYSRGNRVEIQPVGYVFSDGWIYGRTSYGAKYEALGGTTAYQWWPVAFEVDEVENMFSWRSVLVYGGFYILDPDGPPPEREAWEKAVGFLRALTPEAFGPHDPVPFRNIVFRIAVQQVTGREAIPARTQGGGSRS